MAKPIPKKIINKFRNFCKELLTDDHDGDDDATGCFCLSMFDAFDKQADDGEPLWEFHASNHDPDDTYDIYELFHSVSDQYNIEQHGYDDFYVIPANKDQP